MRQTLTVKGMHCSSCRILVTEALEEAGAKNVAVEVNEKTRTGKVSLFSELQKNKLIKIIESQGDYKVT